MPPSIPQVSADKIKKYLDANENITLLDVRTTSEFERGRIKGSINLPLQDISTSIESTFPDKQQTIYVYCLSGSRSSIAVEEMIEKGYINVYNMTSGLLDWRAKHYPLVS